MPRKKPARTAMYKALALFALGFGLGIACYCMQDAFLQVDDDPMDKGRGSRKGRGSGKGKGMGRGRGRSMDTGGRGGRDEPQ